MTFSRRTAWPREENAWSRLTAKYDLTSANPTHLGLHAQQAVLDLLADPKNASYDPAPLGLDIARNAVADYYKKRGLEGGHIAITASTSEAYHTLFCVLADPGEAVLVPTPSYPLFSYLADIAGVRADTYPLRYTDEWHVDLASLAAAVKSDTRAIVLVSPNNPTGSVIRDEELAAIASLGLPLIVDEVFADYMWFAAPKFLRAGLTFGLSGLSKVALLPQLKLGWMHVSGPGADEALARIEVVQDSFLSVNTPVQNALPALLEVAENSKQLIGMRLAHNLGVLASLKDTPFSQLKGDGGLTAIIRLPAVRDEDAWMQHLAAAGVRVQPGYFYDLGPFPHAVVSLLTPPDVFAAGIDVLRLQCS